MLLALLLPLACAHLLLLEFIAALRALGAEELGARCLAASLHVSFASDGTVLGRYGRDARREQGQGDGDERASPQPKKAKTGEASRATMEAGIGD